MDRRRQLYQLFDHELRAQAGSSLASWCAARGVDPNQLLDVALSTNTHELLAELGEAIGIAPGTMRSLAA